MPSPNHVQLHQFFVEEFIGIAQDIYLLVRDDLIAGRARRSVADYAKRLKLNERQLQRALKARGTTFRDIRAAAVYQVAIRNEALSSNSEEFSRLGFSSRNTLRRTMTHSAQRWSRVAMTVSPHPDVVATA